MKYVVSEGTVLSSAHNKATSCAHHVYHNAMQGRCSLILKLPKIWSSCAIISQIRPPIRCTVSKSLRLWVSSPRLMYSDVTGSCFEPLSYSYGYATSQDMHTPTKQWYSCDVSLKSSAHVQHLKVLSDIEGRLDAVQGVWASNCVRNMQYANEQQNL